MIRKISARIQELFRPPNSGELDGSFSARLMRILIHWLIGGASVVCIGLLIYLGADLRAVVVALASGFIACMLLLLWMIRRGYQRNAGVALSLAILAFVHIPVLVTGGADSPFVSGYVIAVVVAGLLVRRRWAAMIGALSLASYWYVLAAPGAAVFALPPVPPIAKVVVYGVVMVLLVLCLNLARTVQLQVRRGALSREFASRALAEKYRLLVEKLPTVIYATETGERGAWLYVSPHIETILGFSAEEWIANPELWVQQIHPADRKWVLEQEQVHSREPMHVEYRLIHRDGHTVWVREDSLLVWDEDLQKHLWHGTFVDISERKQAEQATQRLSRELLLLDKVRSALASEVELSALMHTVVESIAGFHGYSHVSLYRLEGEELMLQHQVGYGSVIERIPITMGVSGQVVRTAQPVFLADVSVNKDFLGAIEGIVSEICVPLLDEGRVVGVLNVESADGNKLTEEDLKLISALGEHVSVAIGRARLFSDLQHKSRIEAALRDSTLAIMGEIELSEALQAILVQATSLMGTAHAFIYLTSLAEDELVMAMGTGINKQNIGFKLKRGEGLAGKVWETGQPVNVADYHAWSGRAAIFNQTDFRATLGVPLISGARVIGILGLAHLVPDQSFNDEDVELLSRFAQLASIAIHNARLFTLNQQELADRRAAEAALVESDKRFRAVFEQAPLGMGVIDSNSGQFKRVNAKYTEITGYSEDEMLNLSFGEITHPDDLHFNLENMALLREGRIDSYKMQKRYLRKDGSIVWVELLAVPLSVEGQNSDIRYHIAMVEDVTARRQAESLQVAVYRISDAAAKTSSLDELFQSVHAIIGEVMPANNFYIALVDAAQDLLDFPYFVDEADASVPEAATPLGRGLTEYVIRSGEALLCDLSRFDELVRAGEVVEVGPASPIWLGAPLIVEGRTIGAIALQDYANPLAYGERERHMLEYVSAQVAKAIAVKDAEQALRESEARYRGVLNNMLEGCRIIGFDWRYIYVNEAAAAQGRSNVEELIGQSMVELFPWIENTQAFDAMRMCMEEREPVHMETEFNFPDGSTNWFELSIQPVPEGIFILSVDITENKKAMADLQKATDSLRTIINSSPLAILGYDRNGVVKSWNPAAERIFGWSAAEAVGRMAPYIHPHELPEFHVLRERVVGGETIVGLELRRHKKDSSPIDISLNLAPTYDADGQIDGYMELIEDISARKQRERELIALASVSAALRTASTRAEIMPIVLDQILTLFNARGASLILHEHFTGEGRIESARGVWEYSLGWVIPAGKGATGSVMSSGRSYVTANAREDPVIYFKDSSEEEPLASACVPLSTPNGLIGTINVGRADPFTPEDVRLLENVADIAANAIQRTALHELAVQRVGQLQALHNIDIAITSSLDLQVTLNVLLDQTIIQLNVDAACILKMSDSLYKLSLAAARGFETPEDELAAFERNATFAGRVAGERHSIIISEIRQETMPVWFSSFLNREKFVSYIGVPLIAKGTLVGVLEVFHRSPIQATSEWVKFLETLATEAALAVDNADLFTNLQQSNVSLALSYDATIEGWSRALDLRDKETEGHTQRVTELTVQLARLMQIPEEQITHMRRGALLHDIGKMGIPDSILLKPAALTEEEMQVMRQHPKYAYDLISPIRYLQPAIEIPFCHHEKWDGTGYPRGLAGERIPMAARIFAVTDVWDALTSDRPYREAWPEDKALEYIRMNSGTHLDPQVVEVFLNTRERFS